MTKKNFRKLLCVVLSVMLFVSNAPFTGIVLASDISRSQPEEGSLITENTPQTSDVPLAIEDVATEPVPLSERLPQFSEYELALADMCDYPQSMRGPTDLATTSNITYPITNLSGSYYINHTKTGFFLRTSYPNVSSSYYYEMDETEYPWTFEWLHTNRYIIYSTNHQWDSVSMLRVMNGSLDLVMYDEEPPNECIWEAYYADFGGVTIKNLGTGLSLHMVNGSLGVSLAMPSTHADYDNWVWGMVSEENYSVPTDITINDDWVIPCISKQIFVSATPSNTPWTTQENFTFSITPHNPGNTFTVNEAGEITSSVYGGTAILTVTHKPTRLTRTFRIASGFVREGIYMLKNKRTEKYMDVEGPSMGDDAPIQQWQYHSGSAAKWYLTIHETGDYSIQSLYSGKYMHVYGASEESGAGIVQYTGSVGSNARWTIQITGGGYRISPLSAPTLALSVPLGQDGNGLNLQQLSYSNDNEYSDTWDFQPLLYNATLNNFYDRGYYIRYGETYQQSEALIKEYSTAVSKRYMEIFGLSLCVNDTSYFGSAIDACKGLVNSANIDVTCEHTDREAVISNFKSSHEGDQITTNAFWSGHKIQSTASSGVINNNRSCSDGTAIFMLGIWLDSSRTQNSQGVLLHELAHQFGAGDHYHEPTKEDDDSTCKFKDVCSVCNPNQRPQSCIMYQSHTDITATNVICDYCRYDILAHLQQHH